LVIWEEKVGIGRRYSEENEIEKDFFCEEVKKRDFERKKHFQERSKKK